MRFLFSITPSLKNEKNNGGSVVDSNNPIVSSELRYDVNENDDTVLDKNTYIINKTDVKNYIQSNVNKPYRTEKNNPYVDLIKFTNEDNTPNSLKLKSSDFAYLRDIGVMPLNRLMILRRFPEGTVVPVDLNDLNTEPISTVIGWVKADSNLFSFNFNEKWQSHTTMLHHQLREIVNKQFGIDIGNVVPVPGWGVGFMFQVLNEMGLTSYNKDRLPLGDPNLLQESLTRPHEEFGLESGFDFDFETFYEQKYIADIDPTVSTFDIINNLLKMGTSNTRFFGKKGSDLIQKIRNANESYNSANAWIEVSSIILKGFIEALRKSVAIIKEDFSGIMNQIGIGKENSSQTEEENTETEEANNTEASGTTTSVVDNSIETAIGGMTAILETKTAQSIIASTLGRYQWPLRGSISMFTGDATTPWHLTIGNPYAPILSMNNIHVINVNVDLGNEVLYNDLPKIMKVKISIKPGRNLGKQEILEMFGVRYRRYYTKVEKNV